MPPSVLRMESAKIARQSVFVDGNIVRRVDER